MIQTNQIYDLLITENSPDINAIFESLSKIFNLTMKFGKNFNEFIELAKTFEFRFVLYCFDIE